MSASATALDLGTLKVKTRIVPSGTISYVCTHRKEPRPQERIVNSLRQKLVASGVAQYRNVRKVMRPFRNLFVLLQIRFENLTRQEAQNKTLMALSVSLRGGLSKRVGEASPRSSGKPPYRNRRYDIAKFGRR